MRQLTSPFARTAVRRILKALLYLYLIVGGLLVIVRYGITPHIDHWRPRIAQQLSQTLGLPVDIDSIAVNWHGWDPRVKLNGLRLEAADGRHLLAVPHAEASLNWSALLPGHHGALRLRVSDMDLTVVRQRDNRLWVLGQTFRLDEEIDVLDLPWVRWTLSQPHLAFENATVRWQDQRRNAPELRVDHIQALLSRDAGNTLQLSLSAQVEQSELDPPRADSSPPTPMVRPFSDQAAHLALRVRVKQGALLRQGVLPPNGTAWLRLTNVRSNAWGRWVDLPDGLDQGATGAQLWLERRNGATQLTLAAHARGVRLHVDNGGGAMLPSLRMWSRGSWREWVAAVEGDPFIEPGLAMQLRSQGLRLTLPALYEHSLAVDDLTAIGSAARGEDGWHVKLEKFTLRNPDVAFQAKGSWRPGGPAGIADLTGTVSRARLTAIARYLPRQTNAEARQWLAAGLRSGEFFNGRWILRGELAKFPFSEFPAAGDFKITGDYRDARVEFLPDAPPAEAWPTLDHMSGSLDLHRGDLKIQALQATMQPAPDQTIALSGLRARIPDLENEAVLGVSGHSRADGNAYLSLLRHSPLGGWLGNVFDDAKAEGQWRVPLALSIPLQHARETQVWGRVDFQGSSLRLWPQAPPLRGIDGSLHFNEHGARVAQPIRASLLGGAFSLSGSLDEPGSGLAMHGRLQAKSLEQFVGLPGMKRFQGSLDYDGRLNVTKRGYALALDSDTKALEIKLPAPLAKIAGQPRGLHVSWTDEDPRQDVVEVRYGDSVRILARHRRGRARNGPYFERVAVGVGQAPELPPHGFALQVAFPLLDLGQWRGISEEFDADRGFQKAGQGTDVWPDLVSLSLQADQMRVMGTHLDHAVLRAVKKNEGRWSANIRSAQTQGILKWREQEGRIVGRLTGQFERLSLGDNPRDTGSLLPESDGGDAASSLDDDLNFPEIVLKADDFRLYGHSVGALALEGTRDADQPVWQLDRLTIQTPNATLRGTGTWRLRAPNRGLHLKANVQAKDLGAWMDSAGFQDVMSGGEGTLKGHFEWPDLPWSHDMGALNGALEVSLDEGRFVKLGSRSAKLLELLSLQSISRLNRLDQGLSGLAEEGIPFDRLRGKMTLNDGVARIDHYKLVGSVGTVVLEGSTNIVDESLDMQAVVVPNLDASGAAIAAGIALNPVIGLGAFITQWLLKKPLSKAMAAHYHITGDWDDIHVDEVPVESEGKASGGHKPAGKGDHPQPDDGGGGPPGGHDPASISLPGENEAASKARAAAQHG